MSNTAPGRILEVGRIPVLSDRYPETTTWVRTGGPLLHGDATRPVGLDARHLYQIARALQRQQFDLIVLPAINREHRGDQSLIKKTVRAVAGLLGRRPLLGAERRDRRPGGGVVIADYSDYAPLSYTSCALFPNFLCYFKRELYPDVTFRSDSRLRPVHARIEAQSLMLPHYEPELSLDLPKTTDLFFAGAVNTPLRRRGMQEVRQLAADGVRVDIPSSRLSYRAYLERMAQAWLVWSPAGFGWDCYRHYEASFARSVPVISEPPHPRALYLRPGVHSYHYSPEPGGLTAAVRHALSDKGALNRMATAGRETVTRSYTRHAVAERMLATIVQHRAARRA